MSSELGKSVGEGKITGWMCRNVEGVCGRDEQE